MRARLKSHHDGVDLDVFVYKNDLKFLFSEEFFETNLSNEEGEEQLKIKIRLTENPPQLHIKPIEIYQLTFFGEEERFILGYELSINRKTFENYVGGNSGIEFIAGRGIQFGIPLDRIHISYEDL